MKKPRKKKKPIETTFTSESTGQTTVSPYPYEPFSQTIRRTYFTKEEIESVLEEKGSGFSLDRADAERMFGELFAEPKGKGRR